MPCSHCEFSVTTEQSNRTALDYCRFHCHICKRGFNERTGTLFIACVRTHATMVQLVTRTTHAGFTTLP
jgi:hypothetical protein